MDLVTVNGLSKRYGGIVALSEATFSARAGEVHALLGENGAGKSTFIQILSGAVRHDGGSILVDGPIAHLTVLKPEHFAVANAVGAAIAQVSGEVDRVYSLAEMGRDAALNDAKEKAVEAAVAAGARRDSIEIVDVEDVPLAYLPGNATRVRVKAVGELHVR